MLLADKLWHINSARIMIPSVFFLASNKAVTMKFHTIVVFLALFALARAAYEQKKQQLLSQCGRDLNRGEYYEKTNLGDFPWLALLQYETRQGEFKSLCGGVLISDQYVLTAAHCADSPSNQLLWVILGDHNTETDPDCLKDVDGSTYCSHFVYRVAVDEVIIHEDYSSFGFHLDSQKADLALLKLKVPVTFTDYIQPICLPYFPEREKQTYYVAGWGKSMAPGGDGFTEKLVSRARTLTEQECYRYPVTNDYSGEEHICAGANQRVCVGDAGGPLMGYENKGNGYVSMTVFGVGFMDLTCQYNGIPGVYTKVYKYMPWIEQHIFN